MNSTLLKSLLITVFFVSAYSCGTSEDGSEGIGSGGNGSGSKLGGSYTIISMESDIIVDLNNDGITSFDLLTEIDPSVFSTALPELEIKPVVINNKLENMMSFYLPHPTLTGGTSTTPEGVKFTKRGLGYIYEFDDATQTIHLENNVDEPAVNGRMENIQILGNNKLQAVFIKSYFDFSTTSWKLLTITCVYKKI